MRILRNFSDFLNNRQGFSLTELAVVIIIGGVMMMPIYSLLFYVTDLKPTDQRFEIIQTALAEHLRVTGTLPCPADPTVDMDTSAEAFKGQRAASGKACITSGTYNVSEDSDVYIGAVPITDLRVAVGCAEHTTLHNADTIFTEEVREAIANQLSSPRDIVANNASGNSVPSDIRCIPREYLLDEHGHKFVYAVSKDAVSTDFDIQSDTGAIKLRHVGASNNIPVKPFYILTSLGADGLGGYERSGTRNGSCTSDDSGIVITQENCDNDAFFVAGLENLSDANYFDDHIEYGLALFMQETTPFAWGENQSAATNKDTILGDDYGLVVNPGDHDALSANDRLVVNDGGVNIDGNMSVGNNVSVGAALSTENGEIKTSDKIMSDKYDYDESLW